MNLLLTMTLLPSALIMFYIYKMDSHDKEPGKLLALLFFMGAVPTVICALITESIGGKMLDNMQLKNQTLYYFIEAFIIVAISEEGFKLLYLWAISWKNKNFNYLFDGIVYSVFVSMGFATIENIEYVLFNGGTSTAIIRAVTAIPGHATFSIFMGYYYGLAKLNAVRGDKKLRNRNMILTLLVPVLLHGFYDFCAFTSNVWMSIVLFVFILLMDINAYLRVSRSSRENEYLYKQYMEKFPTLNLPYNDYETAYRQVFSTPVYMRRAPQVQQAAGPNAPHGALRPNMQKPVIIPNSPQGAIQPANMVQRPMRPIYRLFCPVCGNEVRMNSFNCPVCKTPLNIKNYLD